VLVTLFILPEFESQELLDNDSTTLNLQHDICLLQVRKEGLPLKEMQTLIFLLVGLL
jgi:hypothetical protein